MASLVVLTDRQLGTAVLFRLSAKGPIKMALRLSSFLFRNSKKYAKLSSVYSRGYAEGNQMSFTFASPAKVFYNSENVKQVDVPSYSGNFGILPNHVPTLAVLKPGVITVLGTDGNAKKYFVSSGSISINDDSSVQILAEEAVQVEDLDSKLCRDGLAKAQQELASASSERGKVEAQISIEVHEALVKALE